MASLRTIKWAQYGYKLKHSRSNSDSDRGSSGINMERLQTGCEESMQVIIFILNLNAHWNLIIGIFRLRWILLIQCIISPPIAHFYQDASRSGSASSSSSASNIDTTHPMDSPDATASTMNTTLSRINSNANQNHNSNTLWHSPMYELVCTRPELCDTIQTKNIHLVLAVDVVCSKGK